MGIGCWDVHYGIPWSLIDTEFPVSGGIVILVGLSLSNGDFFLFRIVGFLCVFVDMRSFDELWMLQMYFMDSDCYGISCSWMNFYRNRFLILEFARVFVDMRAFDELRTLEMFFKEEIRRGFSVTDLYELVQHAGNVLPRL